MGQMLARHHHLFHVRSLLDGPAPSDDPQARQLVQVQGVIAEYERAKIAEPGVGGGASSGVPHGDDDLPANRAGPHVPDRVWHLGQPIGPVHRGR
jgi:hypothetical protein